MGTPAVPEFPFCGILDKKEGTCMDEPMNVLVTGGSRGIGRAVVSLLAARGCRVAFTYEKDHPAAESLCGAGEDILSFCTDAGDFEAAARVVGDLEARWGRIDGTVLNAGVSWQGLFTDMEPGQWQRILSVNLEGVLNYAHALVPGFVRQKKGSLVAVSSIWGRRGASCESVYAASKGAVEAFVRSLSRELGPSGIRVNGVRPGLIATDMNRHLAPEELEDLTGEIPLGMAGTPEDVAEAVWFLLGSRARYITGEILTVSGGY